MRAQDRLSIASAVSVLLAMWALSPLTVDRSFGYLSLLLIGLLTAFSIGLRRSDLAGGVLWVQLLVVAGFSLGLSVLLPGAGDSWLEHYRALWAAGVTHMQTQGSPMAANVGVTLIFVTSIGLIAVLTDLIVCGIDRPAWGIAPPAALFLVPALGLNLDTGVFSFLCVAVGYLGILAADGINTSARWTRGLSRDSGDGLAGPGPMVWRATALLAVPAVIGALILSFLLPTLSLPGIGNGDGPGTGGPLQLTDPTLDLRRNLTQPRDREVITYQTDAPGGTYLKLAVLPKLSQAGWGATAITLTEGKTLPVIPGVTDEAEKQRTTTVKVEDFGSQYLPLPYAPRSFDAAGDWSYDPNSLIVVNGHDRPGDLRNLTYQVRSVDVSPGADGLADAAAGTPTDDAITSEVPKDLPKDIVQLAEDVTKKADTPAAKAAAIQAYLRSSRFTYSTERLPGSGYQALENFLLDDQTGYCEQFASAMAVMARVAGIPSRISVGFLPGKADGDTWRVGIRDMHAWPELYFAGYGWVRFEPTPASRTGAAPGWTVPAAPEKAEESDPSTAESAKPEKDKASPTPTADPAGQTPAAGSDSTGPRARTLLEGLGGLVVLLILAAPATIRLRRRQSRFAEPVDGPAPVEAAWAEIRDTVVDYGGTWPNGSPRTIGTEIGTQLDVAQAATMTQVATLVERARYSRDFTDTQAARELPRMTDEIRAGLAQPLSRGRRLRALLLPTSLFRRTGTPD